MKQQITTQIIITFTLTFIGHYFGVNIMVASGFGIVCGFIIRGN